MMLARLTSIPVPYIVSAVAIAAVVALAVAHELSPPALPAAPPAVSVQLEQFPAAPKGDAAELPLSHTVRTVPITLNDAQAAIAAAVAEPVVPQEAPQRPVKAAPTRERPKGDICARHGGHRVDDGRKWHCAYPDRKAR